MCTHIRENCRFVQKVQSKVTKVELFEGIFLGKHIYNICLIGVANLLAKVEFFGEEVELIMWKWDSQYFSNVKIMVLIRVQNGVGSVWKTAMFSWGKNHTGM